MTAFSRLLNGSDTSAVPGNLKLRQNTKDKLIKLRQNTKDKLQLLLRKKTGEKKNSVLYLISVGQEVWHLLTYFLKLTLKAQFPILEILTSERK